MTRPGYLPEFHQIQLMVCAVLAQRWRGGRVVAMQ